MRIAALVFVVTAIVANFFVDHPVVFALALLAYPVAVWLVVGRRKLHKHDRISNTRPRTDAKRNEI